MGKIKNIEVEDISVPQIHSRDWLIPNVPSNHPPITTQIGFPIVDMPGCVKMHKDNTDHVTRLPFDHDLVNQDENGVTTLCPHGEYPSYDAMDYQPENLIITRETPPPPVAPPPTPPEFKADEIPKTKDEKIECPAPNQPRVGDLTQNGDERVVGHEIQSGQCVVLYEPTTTIEKFLPSTNQVSTTAAIAIVATASAAATPLLIRVIKPVIKKIWATIQKKLGREVKQLSKSEIQTNKYREKRGLPPIKRK